MTTEIDLDLPDRIWKSRAEKAEAQNVELRSILAAVREEARDGDSHITSGLYVRIADALAKFSDEP